MNYFQLSNAEWKKLRWGKFTGSNCYRLMGKGFDTYVNEVACERYTAYEHTDFEGTWEMRQGKAKEPQAFEFHRKILSKFAVDVDGNLLYPFIDGTYNIEYFGDNKPVFKEFDQEPYKGWMGNSLDSLISKRDGTPLFTGEYKCPKRDTHMFYLQNIKDAADLKEHKPEYYWQMQSGFLNYGVDLGHFCSYNEFFPFDQKMLLINVAANKNDQRALKIKLDAGIEKAQEIIEKLSKLKI